MLAGILLVASVATLPAQSSVVPANHPVYNWLLMQRVNGFIPEYQDEVRPMSRATVVGMLHKLEADSMKLGGAHRALLRDFLNEFDMKRLVANRLFTEEFFHNLPGSILENIPRRTDPVVYAGITTDSVFSGAFYVNYGLGEMSLKQGTSSSGYLATKGFKIFANASFGLGFHVEADNVAIMSNRFLLARDEKWGSEYLYRMNPARDASTSSEAFVSFRAPYVEMHLGRGSSAMGPAITDPLILRPDAPNIASFRIQVGKPTLNYVYTLGHLDSDPFNTAVLNVDGDSIIVRRQYDRWVAIQRLTWQPIAKLTLAVHEMTIFSARGLDLDYLNPVNPQFFSQPAKGDLDNSFAGFDIIARPISGTEVFSSLLIDDLVKTTSLLTFNSDTTKIIATLGLRQRIRSNMQFGASYTRSDAFTYTHKFYLNAWENDGRPLGQSIGPNAKEYAARVTTWLPLRTKIMTGARFIQRGFNPVDANGKETENVGGNLLEGDLGTNLDWKGLFYHADVQDIHLLELEAETEVIRGLHVSVKVQDTRVTRGLQLPTNRFVDFRLRYGF